MPRDELQLAGVTAMHIASKLEEYRAPAVNKYIPKTLKSISSWSLKYIPIAETGLSNVFLSSWFSNMKLNF